MTMPPMMLDFVRRPFPIWPGIVLLAIGLGVMTDVWSRYQAAGEALAEAEHRLEKLQRQHKPALRKPVSGETGARLQSEFRQAQRVGDFLLLPWKDLFVALEKAAMPDVALLSVEPDATKREVRITAEAKDTATLFAYVKRLESVPRFHDVHLMRHEIREDDKQHPIRFTVAAFWRDIP
jgi:hypothetical protein